LAGVHGTSRRKIPHGRVDGIFDGSGSTGNALGQGIDGREGYSRRSSISRGRWSSGISGGHVVLLLKKNDVQEGGTIKIKIKIVGKYVYFFFLCVFIMKQLVLLDWQTLCKSKNKKESEYKQSMRRLLIGS
jgi:hypothetical protein